MIRTKFIGLKHISGEKNGRNFSFDQACLTSEMSTRDLDRGAKGQDVHTPVVPERYADIFTDANIGKEFDIEFYFANKRENIGYAALVGASK